MAKVYGASSLYLERQKNLAGFKESIGLIISVILCFALLVFFTYGLVFGRGIITKITLLTLFISLISFLYWSYRYSVRRENFYNGQQGEELVLESLKTLPDNYSIFYDVKFYKKRGNMDFVVMGPTGIFAIEVKNRRTFNLRQSDLNQTMRSAMYLKNYLAEYYNQKFFVQAVLVVVNKSGNQLRYNHTKNIAIVDHVEVLHYILSRKDVSRTVNILYLQNFLQKFVLHNVL